MKSYLLILVLFVGISLNAQNGKGVNSEFNKKYKKSLSSKTGTLSTDEFVKMKSSLSEELQINLEENKAVVVHYFQYGKNCILAGYKDKEILHVLNNIYRLASSAEKRFNIKNYYVYNSNSFFEFLLVNQQPFVLDSGFFKEVIFTEDKNCQTVYILKNNGEYLICYGEDISDEIEVFLSN